MQADFDPDGTMANPYTKVAYIYECNYEFVERNMLIFYAYYKYVAVDTRVI